MPRNTIQNSQTDALFDALRLLQTREEFYSFFDDLCTVKELTAMGQRFEVARLLDQELTFTEITEQTGASPATISRVNRCLQYGEGYSMILDRIKKNE